MVEITQIHKPAMILRYMKKDRILVYYSFVTFFLPFKKYKNKKLKPFRKIYKELDKGERVKGE